MSIFAEMMKKYDKELEELTYKVAFVNACQLIREVAKKVAQGKVIVDQLLDGMYISFYDESEDDMRWMHVGYLEGDDLDGLDIERGINLAQLEINYFDIGELMSYIEAVKDETSFTYENTYATIEEQLLIAINSIKAEINENEENKG